MADDIRAISSDLFTQVSTGSLVCWGALSGVTVGHEGQAEIYRGINRTVRASIDGQGGECYVEV